MVEISERDTPKQDLLSQLLMQRWTGAFSFRREQPAYTPKGREVHDTVELSDGAKIVNLGRGLDLARAVRAEKDPDALKDALKQGSSDIERIGRLFRALFAEMRSLFGRSY